jgi:hypothetical protein
MSTTKLYGASDDLIEVSGDCDDADEFSGGETRKYFAFSNGTIAAIRYDERGVWAIEIKAEGAGKIKKLFGLPDDADEKQQHGDKDAPSYSDVLIIETPAQISLIYKGSKPPKPPHKGLPKARAILGYLEADCGGFDGFWADVEDDDRNRLLEGIAKIAEGEKP